MLRFSRREWKRFLGGAWMFPNDPCRMKTDTVRFCETLLRTLADFGPSLAHMATSIGGCGELTATLPVLRDAAARVRTLSDKLANQHAYLLVFGPLKSGKSTLMNALSGAYVSEVTSLPGYPALVFVRHGSEPGFSITRYNGRESHFTEAGVLKETIAESHLALAEQLRAAELRGEEFEPRRHFPEAVWRIEVRLPVANLAESATVLVDTPGLYSRMNFSYDILTREFRDTAACAIFVVKSDNLFLEQVFAEFNRLLDLFSRIFLVVNVDAGKRDLQPDGTLAPSAESENPQRIVEAFTTLSMAGPLRVAHEAGRLRIHAVDLMHAASARLSGQGNGGEAFVAFERDLMDYLNSSDYTREFIRDSLRQSQALCRAVAEAASGGEVAALRERQATLTAEIAALDGRLAALDRLLQIDWRSTFGETRIASARRSVAAAEARAEELRGSLEAALDRWYDSDGSLKALEQQHWNPLMRAAGTALSEETVRHLRTALATPVGGSLPTPETMIDLHTAGFDLAAVGRAALAALEMTDTVEPYRIPVKAESVPVRKTFTDRLLFRSAASLALRIFGEDRALPIPPEVKQQRLPARSRAAFRRSIDTALHEKFPDLPAKSAAHLLEHYIDRFHQGAMEGLRECREQTIRDRAERQGPCEQLTAIAAAMLALKESAEEIGAEVASLGL
jgi:GTPase SAR1 family protein